MGKITTMAAIKIRMKTEDEVTISPLDVKIVGLLSKGYKGVEIAKELVVDKKKVDNNLASMYRKLNCKNAAQLVYFFQKKNFIK